MKTSLTYGFLIALAGLVMSLLFYFAGFHADAEKMSSGLVKTLGIVLPIGYTIVGLTLAMREARSLRTSEQPWGYGSAFGSGMLTALFAALFSVVFIYLYVGVINPNYGDVLYQMQVAAMEAKNVPAENIERAEPMMRKMMSPVMLTVIGTVFGLFWSVIFSLLVAIFVRKPVATTPAAEPPALA